MNRITEITKRDILDLFQNGLEIDEFFQTRTVTYNYYGRLEEIDFVELKNQLIQQGRYTDCIDELIFKVINAPTKRMKIEYV